MSERLETSERRRNEEIYGETARLSTLRVAVGHALSAAELGRADLLERISGANERLRDSIGLGMALGTNEVFEVDEDNKPHRILPSDFTKALGRAGIFRGLELFDRARLPATDNERLPWYDNAEERLEICYVLDPDPTNNAHTVVQMKTLVPAGKIEPPVVLYESPTGPYIQ